jgi:hypothetical protein
MAFICKPEDPTESLKPVQKNVEENLKPVSYNKIKEVLEPVS